MKQLLIILLLAIVLIFTGYYLFVYCADNNCFGFSFFGTTTPKPVVQQQFQPRVQTQVTPPISNELVLDEPLPNAVIASPLTISGKVRGNWMFEASMPALLLDDKNQVIKQFPITTSDDWMTTDFVHFKITIEFQKPAASSGFLIIKNDNPSGLPEKEKSVRIPIRF